MFTDVQTSLKIAVSVGDCVNRGSWTTVHRFHSDVNSVFEHLKCLLKRGCTWSEMTKDLESDVMCDGLYVI